MFMLMFFICVINMAYGILIVVTFWYASLA